MRPSRPPPVAGDLVSLSFAAFGTIEQVTAEETTVPDDRVRMGVFLSFTCPPALRLAVGAVEHRVFQLLT
jgi:hypothetical protein